MKNGTDKYIATVAYLGKLYDHINAELFGGELVKPVITVQADERNKTNGWWSQGKVWRENADDDGEHELNMTAQQLHRPINEIAATLIHEMCHQFATAHEMKDTSRSGNYHNKLFRKIAEEHGLKVECVAKIVMKCQITKNTSTRKYICPVCGQSVRATKRVNIMCMDCNAPMVDEE